MPTIFKEIFLLRKKRFACFATQILAMTMEMKFANLNFKVTNTQNNAV
ncbi:MAG: hypothetical protein IJM31_01560 [Campylobacter sp.]|nr:hypothetical protein [Campylobacter sp.]MBQ9875760.1 hypothetical protein [Campylobacter sp.]